MRKYDYLVVGGGTAGCVLASRLSENPNAQIALLEAGTDYPPGQEPDSIRDPFPASYGDPQYAWPELVAEVGARRDDGGERFKRHYVQGRGIGGSSSIMGMMAQRGLPCDFDEWARCGAEGWGWDDVLPYFKRLETDWDFDDSLHGLQGPIPIRRIPRESWGPFCQAVGNAIERQGYPWLPDLNGEPDDGLSAVPMNNTPRERVSAASAYLTAEVRQRRNLHIISRETASQLLWEGKKVVGVKLERGAHGDALFARETILCAGALHTPALMLRSGIGATAHLQTCGIEPVHHLPGVGQNLANHPTVHLAVYLPRRGVQQGSERGWAQAVLRYSSGHPGCASGDMLMFPANKTSWHPLGSRIGVLGMCVYKSYSRGKVTLDPEHPYGSPQVRMNLLDDPRDHARLVAAVAFGLRVLADSEVAGVRGEIFLPPGGQANALNRPSRANYWKSAAISALFSASGRVRRRALRGKLLDPAALASDEAAIRRIVQATAAPVHHVCGTARIGSVRDPNAVVDTHCRVHGIDGLRVADASVMPTIVSANTHLTVLMIAEKVAVTIAREAP